MFRIHSTASNRSCVGTGLRPARPSGMLSSGKCPRISCHRASLNRCMRAIVKAQVQRLKHFEIASREGPRPESLNCKVGTLPTPSRSLSIVSPFPKHCRSPTSRSRSLQNERRRRMTLTSNRLGSRERPRLLRADEVATRRRPAPGCGVAASWNYAGSTERINALI